MTKEELELALRGGPYVFMTIGAYDIWDVEVVSSGMDNIESIDVSWVSHDDMKFSRMLMKSLQQTYGMDSPLIALEKEVVGIAEIRNELIRYVSIQEGYESQWETLREIILGLERPECIKFVSDGGLIRLSLRQFRDLILRMIEKQNKMLGNLGRLSTIIELGIPLEVNLPMLPIHDVLDVCRTLALFSYKPLLTELRL